MLLFSASSYAQTPNACLNRQKSYDGFQKAVQSGARQLAATDPTCYQQITQIVEIKDESKKCFGYSLTSGASVTSQGAASAGVVQANNFTVMAQLYDQNKNNCDMYSNWLTYKCTNKQNPVVLSAQQALSDFAQCAGSERDKAAANAGQARRSVASSSGQYQVAGLLKACYMAYCLLSNGMAVDHGIKDGAMINVMSIESAAQAPKPKLPGK